ncbi:MAG: HNH endonuclease [Burkholderiales bacterium]
MEYLSLFRMPTPVKITGRSSSITNAFINSIIPVVPPSEKEVRQALEILGMTPETFQCAYCGDVASEWDHLRPLVKDKKPTGYISEIHNLVPSCGKCNQSKGNKEWKTWMLSGAKLSPTARGIKNMSERVKRLETYEQSKAPTKMDFAAIVGKDIWAQHQSNLERVQTLMRESQELAAKINVSVANAYKALQFDASISPSIAKQCATKSRRAG